MWIKFKNIVSQYLEINETRKSTVLLILIFVTIIGIYKAYLGTDIPPVIGNIIVVLAGYIFGLNVGNAVSNLYSSYVENKNIGSVDTVITREDDDYIQGGV